MYDERKEGTQTQISAHAVGSDGYYDRALAYVRPGMQHGNTSILSLRSHSFDIRDVKLPGSVFRLDGAKANFVAGPTCSMDIFRKGRSGTASSYVLVFSNTIYSAEPHFEQNTRPAPKIQVSEKIISRDRSIFRSRRGLRQIQGSFFCSK